MLRQMLKSKIHRAIITDAELHYEGSIACDPDWLGQADILPGEKVLVANLNNGARFETYALAGKKGQIGLRGAARLGQVGDRIIIMGFGLMDDEEARRRKPAIVYLDEHNHPRHKASSKPPYE
jgi:aspartate 1-decarboxylase